MPDKSTIFIIAGMGDIDIATNQSLKNTVKYLSEFGYRIHVFAAFPKNYRILQDPKAIFNDRVVFHRSPNFLIPLFDFGKIIKDSLGRSNEKKTRLFQDLNPSQKVRYYDEYNFLGRMLYAVFLFLYAPFEILRVLFYRFRVKPDLFYGINGQGSAIAIFLGKLLRVPVLQRWHGCSYTEQDVINIKKHFFHKLLLLDGGFAKMLPSEAVVVTDDGTQGDKIFPLLGVPPDKLHFWMNGMDMDDLNLPDDWNPNQFKASLGLADKKILVMASRLVLWKRVDRGVHALSQLVHRHHLDNAVLLIIGQGQEQERLAKQAQSLGISEQVRFIGSVPHREIAKYFSITDVFLSLYDVTNLGNPTLEAMYMGLPIVTIDDGSTGHLLCDGVNAFLVPYENLDSDLSVKIKTLLMDDGLRQTMGKNARLTASQKILTWKDRIGMEHLLIQKLVANGK